jgi:rubrerythrin
MNKKESIEAVKTAMQTELNGINFYNMAAEKTADEKGKAVFRLLADDEKKHFNELLKHYQSLTTTNKWAPDISLNETATIFKGESPIFNADFKERIEGKHFEMSALSIGALLESNSIDFYRNMADQADDPGVKDLFTKLWKWEQTHLEAITRQLDLLKEDYWAEQHFSPLF